VVIQHVRPHAFDHAAVGDFKLGKFTHNALVLKSFFGFELWNPVLRQELNEKLVYFYVMNYVFLDLYCVDLV
jgi:hypothetical protein